MNLVFELFDQDSIINARASAQNEVETYNSNVDLCSVISHQNEIYPKDEHS